MRRGVIGVGLVSAAAALLIGTESPVQSQEGPREPAAFAWETDLETARARAAREGRPLLVVFR